MKIEKPYTVVLGLGGSNALGITRSLGYYEIPIVGFHCKNREAHANHSRYMNSSYFFDNEEDLVDELVEFGRTQEEKLTIFPTGDDYIVLCSRNRNRLMKSFHVPYSPIGTLESLIEKERNLEIGRSAGFRIPESFRLMDYDFQIKGPVIVKPSNSIIGGKKDMMVYYDPSKLEKDRKEIIKRDPNALVQEYIFGDFRNLFEVHVYNGSSGPSCFGMQRNVLGIEINPSIYVGAIFENFWDNTLVAPSLKLAKNLCYNGALDINLKKSMYNGEYYFMEVNFRTSANLSLDTSLGNNLPLMIYEDLTGRNFRHLSKNREEIQMARWVHEPRIKRFFDQGGSREELLRSLRNIRANFLYDPIDIEPFEFNEISDQLDSEILTTIKLEQF